MVFIIKFSNHHHHHHDLIGSTIFKYHTHINPQINNNMTCCNYRKLMMKTHRHMHTHSFKMIIMIGLATTTTVYNNTSLTVIIDSLPSSFASSIDTSDQKRGSKYSFFLHFFWPKIHLTIIIVIITSTGFKIIAFIRYQILFFC